MGIESFYYLDYSFFLYLSLYKCLVGYIGILLYKNDQHSEGLDEKRFPHKKNNGKK